MGLGTRSCDQTFSMTESGSEILSETVIISKYVFQSERDRGVIFHALAGERPSKVLCFCSHTGGSRVLFNRELPVGAQVFMGHQWGVLQQKLFEKLV